MKHPHLQTSLNAAHLTMAPPTSGMSEHLGEDGGLSSDLRLVLLGNIGCGKTSSVDTLLGRVSLAPADVDSRSCRRRRGLCEGRSITLVEAPRWYWNGCKMEDGVRKETQRAMALVAPGPHAVLLLVPVSQFTEVIHLSLSSHDVTAVQQMKHVVSSWQMEARVPAELEEMFGKEVLDHTVVLLTCGDYLMGRTAQVLIYILWTTRCFLRLLICVLLPPFRLCRFSSGWIS